MRQKIHRGVISIALVTLFLSYYGASTLFSHTHQYDWGKVTHSHPYLPSAGHSHNAASLQTIDSLSNLLLAVASSPVVVVSVKFVEQHFAPFTQSVKQVGTLYISLRAPPVVY